MAKGKTKDDQLGPIEADRLYPMSVIKRLCGVEGFILRKSQANGLRMLKWGRRKYAMGRDVISHLEELNS